MIEGKELNAKVAVEASQKAKTELSISNETSVPQGSRILGKKTIERYSIRTKKTFW